MRYVQAVFAFASVAAGLILLAACSGIKIQTLPAPTVSMNPVPTQTLPANPKPTAPANPKVTTPANPLEPDYGPPVVTDPKKLAQDLYDDDKKGNAFRGYVGKNLEIEGVITTRSRADGFPIKDEKVPIGEIDFVVPVTDKAGKAQDYHVHSRFKDPIPPEDPRYAGLAVGKKVTTRGHLTGGGGVQSPHATLNDCVLVVK
jgi:hypothetical protein